MNKFIEEALEKILDSNDMENRAKYIKLVLEVLYRRGVRDGVEETRSLIWEK